MPSFAATRPKYSIRINASSSADQKALDLPVHVILSTCFDRFRVVISGGKHRRAENPSIKNFRTLWGYCNLRDRLADQLNSVNQTTVT